MKHYAGLDVSVKETSVCIVDETGAVCHEIKVASHPEELVRALKNSAWQFVRIGLEAGPLSQWLYSGLVEAGLPAICIETRHAKAFLKAQVNKTDRNDARGIAQMMRVNLFRPVHVKTLTSQSAGLLTARKLLQEKAIAIENDIRGCCATSASRSASSGRSASIPGSANSLKACLIWRRSWALLAAGRSCARNSPTASKVLEIVRDDTVCNRLMTIPGVGPVTSLAFMSAIDVPARFRSSRAVGPALGLTPVLNQSGESRRVGRISLCGDGMMRTLLYEAAQVMLTRTKKWSWLKGLGDERCQTTRPQKSERRARPQAGSDHASHVERWHRSSAGQGRKACRRPPDRTRYVAIERRRKVPPAGGRRPSRDDG